MPSQEQIEQIKAQLLYIANKRARIVIEHILEHGFITTEDLEKTYGYNHPPRAVRDVRELGIPVETFRVKSSDGRSIAAYRFVEDGEIQQARIQGRKVFPKSLKDQLYENSGGKCAVCQSIFEARYLQVDHRVPYEVAGDVSDDWVVGEYMLVCGSCNRAKSWSCEHCVNWKNDKLARVCQTCYWANPDDYIHIALREVRRADVQWQGDEVETYERLKRDAQKSQLSVPDYIKKALSNYLKKMLGIFNW